MRTTQIGAAIENARQAAGLSQRVVEDRTGISQSALSRILSGQRTAKMTEVMQIADATRCTVAQLTGTAIADRVLYSAGATSSLAMEKMRRRLRHFVELDADLDDQGIPRPR